ncbi:MAG: hypothetical protein KY475_02485 [Planctomycetes bacterium]|nr:hypothetical protein [Planctomycetota bacterium]
MHVHAFGRRGLGTVIAAVVVAFAAAHGSVSAAAEPEFVGILALAVEEDVARTLGLSEETRQALVDLIDRREAEALNLALEVRSLPPEERQARLAPVVEESERLGLALLNHQQRAMLERIRLARSGLSTLAEPEIAEKLNLSEEQQGQIETVLAERAEAMISGGEAERRLARADFERRLTGVLTESQLAAWRKEAGLEQGDVQVAQAPPADEPADENSAEIEPLESTASGPPNETAQLRFNFRYAPWKEVIEWFAQQANLSLEGETPLGTFNYTDNRAYSPAEALDLLNSVLLTKGYTLLRKDRILFVVDLASLQDGIPPNLMTRITPEELDTRGEYEIVSVLFPLGKMTPEQAEAELRPLLGRPGEMIVLPLSKQVWITATSGRLKTIRNVLQAVDAPDSTKDLNKYTVEHVEPSEVLDVARKLMGIPEDADGAEDGSIRFTADALSSDIYVSGQPPMIKRFEQILEMVDVQGAVGAGGAGPLESPQLEVYPITDADPTTVLQVLQTLLAGLPDVRLAIDPLTGSLIAMGRPSEHATIRATLAQLQNETRQIEVLRLYRLDPQLAVLSINRMFGAGGETPDPKAPVVDADPATGMLLVRGTQTQIDQIKRLLEQMGESPETLAGGMDSSLGATMGGNIRVLPLTGRSAQSVLEQVELLWPTMRENRIRVVRPTSAIESRRVNGSGDPSGRAAYPGYEPLEPSPRTPSPQNDAPQSQPPSPPDDESAAPQDNEAARRGQIRKVVIGARNWSFNRDPAGRAHADSERARPAGSRLNELVADRAAKDASASIRFAVDRTLVAQAPRIPESAEVNQREEDAPAEDRPAEDRSGAPPEIIVRVTPTGIIIASEDTEALDEFETLLRTLSDATLLGGAEYTVFYLKYVQAAVAADLITQLITGAPLDDGGGAGGGMMGALMGAALGDTAGGLVGNLLSSGSSTSTLSTGMNIVAEPRLNALVVQAAPQQLDMIEQLLQVIDQESSPEAIQTLPPPRMIPVQNTSAEAVANTVRQIYAQQIASGSGQQRQPNPEDFIRALRGGGGGRSGRNRSEESVQQMTVSVDTRSNSIVVSAPDPLFYSVQALVQALDQPGMESPQTTEVVSITGANASTVRSALTAILGDVVKTGTTAAASSSSTTTGGQQQESRPSSSDEAREQFRQRIEMFNALQRGGGGGDGGRPSFGGGRGPFGGGSPFGGRSFGGDRGDGDRGGDRGRGR